MSSSVCLSSYRIYLSAFCAASVYKSARAVECILEGANKHRLDWMEFSSRLQVAGLA